MPCDEPPKKWVSKMKSELRKQPRYEGYSAPRLHRIVYGIWNGYSEETRRRLTAKYGNPVFESGVSKAVAKRVEKGEVSGSADILVKGVPVHITWKSKGAG